MTEKNIEDIIYDNWIWKFIELKNHDEKIKVIIDCCGIFKNKLLINVVKDIYKYVDKKYKIYYIETDDCVYFYNEENIYNHPNNNNDFSKINEFIFIFDDVHKTGTDFHFADDVCGIMNCNDMVTMRDFTQSIFRLRKIETTQTLKIIYVNIKEEENKENEECEEIDEKKLKIFFEKTLAKNDKKHIKNIQNKINDTNDKIKNICKSDDIKHNMYLISCNINNTDSLNNAMCWISVNINKNTNVATAFSNKNEITKNFFKSTFEKKQKYIWMWIYEKNKNNENIYKIE